MANQFISSQKRQSFTEYFRPVTVERDGEVVVGDVFRVSAKDGSVTKVESTKEGVFPPTGGRQRPAAAARKKLEERRREQPKTMRVARVLE